MAFIAIDARDYNVPAGDPTEITFGQCVIYGNPYQTPTAAGITPSTSLGFIEECKVSLTRKPLDLMQGVPRNLLYRWAIAESGKMTWKGFQWNRDYMYMQAGNGATSGSTDIAIGGSTTWNASQFVVQHAFQDGSKVASLDIYRAFSAGTLEFNFNPEDFNKFDYEFDLAMGFAGWCAESLLPGLRVVNYREA